MQMPNGSLGSVRLAGHNYGPLKWSYWFNLIGMCVLFTSSGHDDESPCALCVTGLAAEGRCDLVASRTCYFELATLATLALLNLPF